MDKHLNAQKFTLTGLLFLVGFAIEFLYIKSYNVDYFISVDGLRYSNFAENFLLGRGLVNNTSFVEGADHIIRTVALNREYVVGPIYPLLLSLVYGMFGLKNYGMVIVAQALLGAGSATITYKTGELLFGKKYAYIPYVLTLGYPLFAFWGMYVLTETTYVFVITFFLYFLASYSKQVERPKRKTIMFLGISIGISILVRPFLLLYFPVLGIWILWMHRWHLKGAIKDFSLIVIMAILVLSPWWIRNAHKYRQFIAVSNYGSYEFYLGNNPRTMTHIYFTFDQPSYDPDVKARIDKLAISEQEKQYKQLAEEYIIYHPLQFLQRTLAKEINLFWQPVSRAEGLSYKMKGDSIDKWYLLLGFVGIFLSFFRLRKYSFLLLFTAYYSFVVSMITVVSGARYRLPVMPAVILLGSLVVVITIKGFVKLLKSLKFKLDLTN